MNPFRRVLDPMEDRPDSLLQPSAKSIQTEYSPRIFDRMAYVEDLCREHVHRVLGMINNRKAELVAKMDKVTRGLSFVVDVLEGKTAKYIKSMCDLAHGSSNTGRCPFFSLGACGTRIHASPHRFYHS